MQIVSKQEKIDWANTVLAKTRDEIVGIFFRGFIATTDGALTKDQVETHFGAAEILADNLIKEATEVLQS